MMLLYGLYRCHLTRVSRQSRLSVNDEGPNEMILGTVYRSPGIYLTAEENLGKPQLRDGMMKAIANSIISTLP